MTEEIIINEKSLQAVLKRCDKLEQENKELSFAIEKCLENAGIECDDEEQVIRSLSSVGSSLYAANMKIEDLEQENKDLKKQIESDKGLITVGGKQQYQYLQRIDKLEQENKELKEENIKVKKEFNNLIAEIISDMEYTGEIACNGESPKEHLHQMQKALSALEEIREIINGHASPSACEYWGSYKNACEPCVLRILNQVEDKIQNRINEVLNV